MIKKNILDILNKAIFNKEDDSLFQLTVVNLMGFLGLNNERLAEMFSMSVPSVKRWVNGTTAPHPSVRIEVYKKFFEMVEKK